MYENAFTHVTDWNIAGQALAEQTSGHAVDCIARLPTARTDGLRRGGSTSSASLLCPKIFFAVTWAVAEPRTSARAGSCSETLVKLADQERQEGTFTAIGLINILIQRGSTAVINVAVSPGAATLIYVACAPPTTVRGAVRAPPRGRAGATYLERDVDSRCTAVL